MYSKPTKKGHEHIANPCLHLRFQTSPFYLKQLSADLFFSFQPGHTKIIKSSVVIVCNNSEGSKVTRSKINRNASQHAELRRNNDRPNDVKSRWWGVSSEFRCRCRGIGLCVAYTFLEMYINVYIHILYVQHVNIDISIHILLMFQKSGYRNQLRLLVVEIYHYIYGPGFIHPSKRWW